MAGVRPILTRSFGMLSNTGLPYPPCPLRPFNVPPLDVRDAFIQANPGQPPSSIMPGRSELRGTPYRHDGDLDVGFMNEVGNLLGD